MKKGITVDFQKLIDIGMLKLYDWNSEEGKEIVGIWAERFREAVDKKIVDDIIEECKTKNDNL